MLLSRRNQRVGCFRSNGPGCTETHAHILLIFVAITPGWFKLCNKDAILVDTVYQGDVQVLNLSPETL